MRIYNILYFYISMFCTDTCHKQPLREVLDSVEIYFVRSLLKFNFSCAGMCCDMHDIKVTKLTQFPKHAAYQRLSIKQWFPSIDSFEFFPGIHYESLVYRWLLWSWLIFHDWYSGLILGLLPSQWETALQSNAVSHWLGAYLESALIFWLMGGWWWNGELKSPGLTH